MVSAIGSAHGTMVTVVGMAAPGVVKAAVVEDPCGRLA
jgi:hypothetical protein